MAKVWGIEPDEIPQAGYTAVEIMEAIHRGEIKGCSRCASIRWCHCPMPTSRGRLSKNSSSSVSSISLCPRRRTHADVVLAGSLHEEEEGVPQMSKAAYSHSPGRNTAGDARLDSQILCDLARGWAGANTSTL